MLLQPWVLLPGRINGHSLLGVMNFNHNFLTWLSWFSNTGIYISLSLKSVLLVFPCLLLSFHPPFFSLLSSSTAKQIVTAFSIFYSEIGSTPASCRSGLCPKPFPVPPMPRARMYSCPLWVLQWTHLWTRFFLLWDSLATVLFSLAQHVKWEGNFTWKSLQLWETFSHAHVLARDLLHP